MLQVRLLRWVETWLCFNLLSPVLGPLRWPRLGLRHHNRSFNRHCFNQFLRDLQVLPDLRRGHGILGGRLFNLRHVYMSSYVRDEQGPQWRWRKLCLRIRLHISL